MVNSTGAIYKFKNWAFPPAANWTATADGTAPYVPTNANCIRLSNTVIAAGYAVYGCCFTLNDVTDNLTAFTALFDQYRIAGVTVLMMPSLSGNIGNQTQANMNLLEANYFQSALDFDDNAVTAYTPASIDGYQTNKIHQSGGTNLKHVKRFLKPRIATAAYGGAAFTSYANESNKWIDLGSPGVQYYGFKVLRITGGGPVANFASPIIDIKVLYHLEFKSVR